MNSKGNQGEGEVGDEGRERTRKELRIVERIRGLRKAASRRSTFAFIGDVGRVNSFMLLAEDSSDVLYFANISCLLTSSVDFNYVHLPWI